MISRSKCRPANSSFTPFNSPIYRSSMPQSTTLTGPSMRFAPQPALLGGVSWQVPGNPNPVTGLTQMAGTVDQITSVDLLPNGPFTGTPSCTKTLDGTGTVICAVEGTNNGLYGIAIHPQQPNPTVSSLVPLLMPGQVLSFGVFPDGLTPCTTANPCNRVGAIASNPSCAATEGRMVICAVNVLLQNTVGAANTTLVGLAFDPRLA